MVTVLEEDEPDSHSISDIIQEAADVETELSRLAWNLEQRAEDMPETLENIQFTEKETGFLKAWIRDSANTGGWGYNGQTAQLTRRFSVRNPLGAISTLLEKTGHSTIGLLVRDLVFAGRTIIPEWELEARFAEGNERIAKMGEGFNEVRLNRHHLKYLRGLQEALQKESDYYQGQHQDIANALNVNRAVLSKNLAAISRSIGAENPTELLCAFEYFIREQGFHSVREFAEAFNQRERKSTGASVSPGNNSGLAPREIAFLETARDAMVAAGVQRYRNLSGDVAETMGFQRNTSTVYSYSIRKKLGVATLPEAIVKAGRAGVIELNQEEFEGIPESRKVKKHSDDSKHSLFERLSPGQRTFLSEYILTAAQNGGWGYIGQGVNITANTGLSDSGNIRASIVRKAGGMTVGNVARMLLGEGHFQDIAPDLEELTEQSDARIQEIAGRVGRLTDMQLDGIFAYRSMFRTFGETIRGDRGVQSKNHQLSIAALLKREGVKTPGELVRAIEVYAENLGYNSLEDYAKARSAGQERDAGERTEEIQRLPQRRVSGNGASPSHESSASIDTVVSPVAVVSNKYGLSPGNISFLEAARDQITERGIRKHYKALTTDVAERLGITRSASSQRSTHARRKLGEDSLVDAVLKAGREGLIELNEEEFLALPTSVPKVSRPRVVPGPDNGYGLNDDHIAYLNTAVVLMTAQHERDFRGVHSKVADTLGIERGNASSKWAAMRKRLGVSSLSDAIIKAAKANVITIDDGFEHIPMYSPERKNYRIGTDGLSTDPFGRERTFALPAPPRESIAVSRQFGEPTERPRQVLREVIDLERQRIASMTVADRAIDPKDIEALRDVVTPIYNDAGGLASEYQNRRHMSDSVVRKAGFPNAGSVVLFMENKGRLSRDYIAQHKRIGWGVIQERAHDVDWDGMSRFASELDIVVATIPLVLQQNGFAPDSEGYENLAAYSGMDVSASDVRRAYDALGEVFDTGRNHARTVNVLRLHAVEKRVRRLEELLPQAV